MVKTLLTNSRGNFGSTGITTAGATQYWKVATCALVANAAEANQQLPFRSTGVISKLYVRVIANATSASSSITLRKNGIATAMTVTIGAAATGVFEDSTNTVTVAAGDKLAFQSVSGGTGTFTMALISVIFDADTNCVSKFAGYGYSHTAASVTNYLSISGSRSVAATIEVNTQNTVKKAGTLKNAYIYVPTNGRTTDTIMRLRQNGASTIITFTIPASTTGLFEDTTNTVSCAVDDEINWEIVSGTGTGTLVPGNFAVDYETTNNGFITSGCVGGSSDITLSPSVTEYYVVGGANIEATTTEAEAQQTARNPFTLSNLTVSVRTNTLTGATPTTVKLRINGADSTQVVSIASAATGFLVDTTHTDIVGPTDTIDFQVITGTAGTNIIITQIAVWSTIGIVTKTLTETKTIGESRTRNKAAWRLQP